MKARNRTASYRGLKSASEAASVAKRSNTSAGGRAERALRTAIWRAGLRYRKHVKTLPGAPDLVFASSRLCVFCDGDFWHGRNWRVLRRQLLARHNPDYWVAKIESNRQRDRQQARALRRDGWRVLRFWETDIISNPDAAIAIVRRAVLEA